MTSRRLSALLTWATAILVFAAGSVQAHSSGNEPAGSTGVINLGPPANVQSTNPYFPLSGFRRTGPALFQHKKPELLFIGAQGPNYDRINIERWPLVKALDRFGRLSHVKPADRPCFAGIAGRPKPCTIATFDLSQARYASRYLAFVSKDLVHPGPPSAGGFESSIRPFQRLSAQEQVLFNRYARFRGQPYCYRRSSSGKVESYPCHTYEAMVDATIANTTDQHTLPLITVGGYLQTVSQNLTGGDFEATVILPITPRPGEIGQPAIYQGYSFAAIQRALITGKDPPQSHLVETVNGEANIITALICHATGRKPASVCGRAVIRSIQRHVR